MRNSKKIAAFFVVVALFGLTCFICTPLIRAGLPFFYNEDEAHHFNRVVEMVQRHDFDPHYFHKPSLHFYLRMPVVAASIEWGKSRGYLSSIREVRTRDPYGIGDYAFTASHPFVVKWTRAFSVLLTGALVSLTFILAQLLGISLVPSAIGALLVALSPEVVKNSPIVGVDVLVATMVLLSVVAAVLTQKKFSRFRLIVTGLICGLAVSSKYNAAPIACLPFLVTLTNRPRSILDLVIASITPILGFFLGSPYILLSFSLFWEQLGYEAWHYAVAGHEGNSAEPGTQQALFYLRWLLEDGIGWCAVVGVAFALIPLWKIRWKLLILFCSFPVLYLGLMIAQRANFTRNMVVIVPFAGVMVALTFDVLRAFLVKVGSNRSNSTTYSCLTLLMLSGATLAQPAIKSLNFIKDEIYKIDSRRELTNWIDQNAQRDGDLAVAGQLLMPPKVFDLSGVDSFDAKKITRLELVARGYDRIALPISQIIDPTNDQLFTEVTRWEGNSEQQRIVDNPTIAILRMRDLPLQKISEALPTGNLTLSANSPTPGHCVSDSEPYCWLAQRITRITIDNPETIPASEDGNLIASLEIMTPWENQEIGIIHGDSATLFEIKAANELPWNRVTFPLPKAELEKTGGFTIYIDKIHSPASRHISPDARRLGAAIRSVSIGPAQ